jgi:hypothetical protein
LLEIVQEIGAVAGWAAVVGLAVLSALYVSHARDVKRLREWAGRAPEQSGRGVTAVPRRATDVPPPAQPQTAATASGAPASLSGPRPATPAGASGPPPVAPQPVRRTPSPQRPITRPAASRAVPQQTVISRPRRSQHWYGRIGSRYVAVALVGLLVLGGAATYGVTQLTGDDGGDDSGNAQANKPKRNGAAVKPGNVTVAVLNGTTVPGLAAMLSDQIAAAGFKKGTINDYSDKQLAESVVQYAPGHQAEARAVSRRLGISQREPVTANSRALAGAVTVIVIAGTDKAP